MNNRQMQASFELLATSEYGAIDNKPSSREIEMWLNKGKDEFYKTRYSGINFKGLAYEQDQKRTEDLRNLKETVYLEPLRKKEKDVYTFKLPDNYFIVTREAAFIMPETDEARKCWRKRVINEDETYTYFPYRTQVMECTDDSLESKLNSRLSDHIFQGSTTKPLRVNDKDTISLFTDHNYSVEGFQITYLRRPLDIDLHTTPTAIYSEFPESVHEEIVKIAVRMFIESKRDPRYQTISNEVAISE